jgi:hypothetical protein
MPSSEDNQKGKQCFVADFHRSVFFLNLKFQLQKRILFTLPRGPPSPHRRTGTVGLSVRRDAGWSKGSTPRAVLSTAPPVRTVVVVVEARAETRRREKKTKKPSQQRLSRIDMDYSRFDHIGASSSEDDDEADLEELRCEMAESRAELDRGRLTGERRNDLQEAMATVESLREKRKGKAKGPERPPPVPTPGDLRGKKEEQELRCELAESFAELDAGRRARSDLGKASAAGPKKKGKTKRPERLDPP